MVVTTSKKQKKHTRRQDVPHKISSGTGQKRDEYAGRRNNVLKRRIYQKTDEKKR